MPLFLSSSPSSLPKFLGLSTSPVFSNLIDIFPSTEYAATVSFNTLESATANAPTGNLHPDSTYSDNALSASISVLD
ncbi:uncharacterized protein METZ01_LOCUS208249, partial [marine metagenome]